MGFHALDFIMYFIIGLIIWLCLPNDAKEELGLLMGMTIMLIFTIVYLMLFGIYPNWDWIDLLSFFNDLEIKW
jgi:ABC-type polysaccharide/polyol phosphate export permease